MLIRVEKYRPSRLDSIVGNKETISRLKVIVEYGNMPNFVISGPPGCGKTTSILCLARELLGPSYKDAVLELNASNDRGIDVVRNKIKMFAQKKVQLPPGRHKIVILDEADSMTGAAQQALRRTMELYSSTTRFAFSCNISEKIIEPIQSRCAILRYGRLEDCFVLEQLLAICESENIVYTDKGLEACIYIAQGDLRQAVNSLQSTVTGYRVVNHENVFKICDQPHPEKIRAILNNCRNNNINASLAILANLIIDGYNTSDIILTMHRMAKIMDLEEAIKLKYMAAIGNIHIRIVQGLATTIQLTALIAQLCKITQLTTDHNTNQIQSL